MPGGVGYRRTLRCLRRRMRRYISRSMVFVACAQPRVRDLGDHPNTLSADHRGAAVSEIRTRHTTNSQRRWRVRLAILANDAGRALLTQLRQSVETLLSEGAPASSRRKNLRK